MPLGAPSLVQNAARLLSVAVVLVCQCAIAQTVRTSTGGRKLAPDALHVIPPSADYGDTSVGPIDFPLVFDHPDLAWQPNYAARNETLTEMAKNVVFRGDAYCLEFAFKPVRMIEADINTTAGVQRKTVWYLLYRLRYLGGDLRPKVEPDQFENEIYTTPEAVSAKWVRTFPTFTLVPKGISEGKRYVDQVLPSVLPAIAAKERVGKPILNSVQMQSRKIELSTVAENNEVWGVATWVDIDPRVDFFSIEVGGITNAQRVKQDGKDVDYLQKVLVLNFSRPGDTIDELEDRIRYGIPALSDPARQKYVLEKFGLEERLDHTWIYR